MAGAIRLIVSQSADGTPMLVRFEKLADMILPDLTVQNEGESARTGLFLEARSPGEGVLAEREIDPEDFAMIEYPTGDPERPLGRVAAPAWQQRSYLIRAEIGTAKIAMVRRWLDAEEAEGLRPAGATPLRSEELFQIDLGEAGEAGQ